MSEAEKKGTAVLVASLGRADFKLKEGSGAGPILDTARLLIAEDGISMLRVVVVDDGFLRKTDAEVEEYARSLAERLQGLLERPAVAEIVRTAGEGGFAERFAALRDGVSARIDAAECDQLYFGIKGGGLDTQVALIQLAIGRYPTAILLKTERVDDEEILLRPDYGFAKMSQDVLRTTTKAVVAAEEKRADPGEGPFRTESPQLERLLEKLDRYAICAVPVLLMGETGTGKELLAQRYHRVWSAGDRRCPLVIVNAAAMARELALSELFGHERDAFTGARAQRKGAFERADGGILFIDEFGDLPIDVQPMLLRTLQEGTFHRLGGNNTIKVDVKVIAATSRSLEELNDRRLFRQDLLYRMTVQLSVPPLRARGSAELEMLARHFIERMHAELLSLARYLSVRSAAPELSPDAIRLLAAQDWPGNVRQLKNVVERAVIDHSDREVLSADCFAADLLDTPTHDAHQGLDAASGPAIPLATYGRAVLNALIVRIGERLGADRAEEALGIKWKTLMGKRRELEKQHGWVTPALNDEFDANTDD